LTSNLASGHLRERVALLGGGVLSCLWGLWQVVL
jgi:type II secretory pathway component PulM